MSLASIIFDIVKLLMWDWSKIFRRKVSNGDQTFS